MTNLFDPLSLPCGQVLPNRICKAAMEENMADAGQVPGDALCQLYATWAQGGPGLVLTGNVMIDARALTGPGGVVLEHATLDDPAVLAKFTRWAESAKALQPDGASGKVWMQISHPGRQVFRAQGTEPVSASATKVTIAGAGSMFDTARALSADEVEAMVTRFADTAEAAERCGFDGVEIHAAHGYLVAQFLSPLTNLREDHYGGSLENRARFLLEIIDAVRARVSPGFGVGVKLNSADFQRGGFAPDDARAVVAMMAGRGVDIVELSGGSYESAAMMGMGEERPEAKSATTHAREMYFIDFAADIAKDATMPIMVTGGVTRAETAKAAINEGAVDIIGVARAFAFNPYLPIDWRADPNAGVTIATANFKNKVLRSLGTMALTKAQLHRLGAGKPPKPKLNPLLTIIADRRRIAKLTKRYKAWLAAR